jgi:hypothetical protein
MSSYAEFQARYEEEGDKLFRQFNQLTEEELLRIIRAYPDNAYRIWTGGNQYQIWQVLAEKGTRSAIQPLYDVVSNLAIEYLVRYHACETLFRIAAINDDNLMGVVQYGLDQDRQPADQTAAIQELGKRLGLV